MPKKGIILGYLFFAVVVVFLYFLFQKNSQETPLISQNAGLKTLTIEKGEGLKEIGEKLKEQGLVKNRLLFEAYALLARVKNNFWPGEYQVEGKINLKDLIKILTGTPQVQEKTLTIIEGWTNKEIDKFFTEQGLIKEGDFLQALEKISQDKELLEKYDFLAEAVDSYDQDEDMANLQGYLFPDTYRFYQETTTEAVIKKMLENFDKKLDPQLREEIKELGRTIHETITMASLIEKEAALDQDRRLVADIFWKRLKTGWALESCATVNYILGSPKPRLTYEDTRTPSSYNTYLHPGLPPGPINNPGISSIRAAIEPLKNDYCCFLSTAEGKIIFSKTTEEHSRNKAIYLK